MKLVADANALFSAFLKDGLTRKLWLSPEIDLYAPGFIFEEALTHEKELEAKTKVQSESVKRSLADLLKHVKLVPDASLVSYLPAAATLTTDEKDWFYFAAALAIDAAIWSNDAGFKKQRRVRIYSTEELAREFGTL